MVGRSVVLGKNEYRYMSVKACDASEPRTKLTSVTWCWAKISSAGIC